MSSSEEKKEVELEEDAPQEFDRHGDGLTKDASVKNEGQQESRTGENATIELPSKTQDEHESNEGNETHMPQEPVTATEGYDDTMENLQNENEVAEGDQKKDSSMAPPLASPKRPRPGAEGGRGVELTPPPPPPAYFPYPGAAAPPPYYHPHYTPQHMWYPGGYYPPPPHAYPPPPHYSPYGPPPPPPSSKHADSNKNDQSAQPPPPPPPGYPSYYYPPGYPHPPTPSNATQQPSSSQGVPMSPLMQQPMFHSPNPSPAGHYSYYPPYPPVPGSGPPYFPPSDEFTKPDTPQRKKPTKRRKSDPTMISGSPSFQEMDQNVQHRAIKHEHHLEEASVGEESEDVRMDSHRSTASVTSSTTESSNLNPMLLATYVKARRPTNQDELQRRAKKNAQSRARAAARKKRIAEVEAKSPSKRTKEEQQFLADWEKGRSRKNNRSRSRALENKERVEMILKKPVEERTKIENQFLDQFMTRKQRKNEGDRLRRERLKLLGLDAKKTTGPKPTVPARGPLPPELMARVNNNDIAATGSFPPPSPGGPDGPYGGYPGSPPGHHHHHHHHMQPPPPQPGYPPHSYPPPPAYWPDTSYPPPHATTEEAPPQYHNSFSIYPTEKGPVATTSSWATPPRSHEKLETTDPGDSEGKRTEPSAAPAVTV